MKAPLLILCIIVGLSSSCENETYGPYIAPPIFTASWPCENGIADIYACGGYDLMSHLSLQDLTPEGLPLVMTAPMIAPLVMTLPLVMMEPLLMIGPLLMIVLLLMMMPCS